MELNLDDAAFVLLSARKKDMEEKLFFRWVTSYQTEMSFEEFKEKITPDRRSAKQILKEAEEYMKQFESGMKKVDINGNF